MNKIISIGILMVFLAAFAQASTLAGTFSVSCDCLVPGELVFTLNNDSSTSQNYTIASVGEHKDWINLNGTWIDSEPLNITLAAGQSKNLYAFVKPQTCYITPGNYTVTVQVYSNDASIVQPIQVTVNPSRVLDISLESDYIELKQCEQKSIAMTITNTGKSDELVSLAVQGIAGSWIEFSDESFLLEKQNSKQMELLVKPDCGAETKEYPFSIKAVIENTGFSTAKSATINIADAQQIEITSSTINSCSEKGTSADITIKNNGRLNDTLELSLDGLDWAEINPSTIDLLPDEQKTATITFSKTNAAPQEYTFNVNAYSKIFNKETEKELRVLLQDCYGITITSVKANGQETGIPEACLEEALAYEFTLLNDRAEAIDIDLSLRGVNALVSPSKATIQPGESIVFNAAIDLSDETAGEKTFEAILKSDFFSTTQEYTFNAVDCYALLVDYNGLGRPIDVNADKSKSERNPFTVKVKNIGTKQMSVSATVIGETWVYFQPNAFQLNPDEEKEIYLYFDPPYDTREGLYENTLNISAEHFSDKKQTSVTVYGGLYALIGEANISASGELNRLIEAIDKTVEMNLSIKNDSNALLQIEDFNTVGYSAEFEFTKGLLLPQDEMPVKMTLFLGKEFDKTVFSVPVQIITDKGTLIREVQIDLNAPQQAAVIPFSGFLPLGNLKDMVLIGLIIIVLALALVMIFRAGSKPEKKEESIESYWQAPPEEKAKPMAAVASPKLKDISRKIRAKPKPKRKTPAKAKKSRAKPKRKRK